MNKIYNAKEMFEMIYDNKINKDDCIEVVHQKEDMHYLYRNDYGEFDEEELIGCLLFKEYKFKIVNQKEAEEKVLERDKQERIKKLEKEIAKLKAE